MPWTKINGKPYEVEVKSYEVTVTKYMVTVIEKGEEYGSRFFDDDDSHIWATKEDVPPNKEF